MKAYEWRQRSHEKEQASKETALLLPRERFVRLIPESTDNNPLPSEETTWSNLTAQQFLAGYSESDSIYDEV